MSKQLPPSMSEFFLMYNEAERALKAAIEPELQRYSLTMIEWLALSTIADAPKEGIRMGAIADRLNIALPQATALIAKLIEKKLCKQHIAHDDHRGRQVQVTLKGRRLLGNMELDSQLAFEALSASIDPDQLESYLAVMQQLARPAEIE